MSVTYDKITNSLETIDYILGANNTSLYMDSNALSIFGPIWLPRVYGKDLTAFEIASSGKIAITLNDIHALDVSQSTVSGSNHLLNTINAKSNYSMELMTNNRDIQTYYDSINNNMSLYAASNIYLKSGTKNIDLTACNDYVLNAKNNVVMTAQDASMLMFANDSNMSLTMDHTTNDMTTYARRHYIVSTSNDIIENANSNIRMSATHGDFNMWANQSNMSILMQGSTSNITTYAGKDWRLYTSNDVIANVNSNILISATHGDYKLWVNDSNMSVLMEHQTSNITTYAGKDWRLYTSNDVIANVNSNILISATHGDYKLWVNDSNMSVLMEHETSNITTYAGMDWRLYTSNDVIANVNSNILISATHGDYKLWVNDSNMSVLMEHETSNITTYAGMDWRLYTSNDVIANVNSNILISATHGDYKLWVNDSNMSVLMEHETSNITTYAGMDWRLYTSNDVIANINSNILISATHGDYKLWVNDSNMSVLMEHETSNITTYAGMDWRLYTSNDVIANINSNILISATHGDYKLWVNDSNMSVLMEHETSNITTYAGMDWRLYTSNDVIANVNSNILISATHGDYKLWVNQSNMFVIMDHLTSNITTYAGKSWRLDTSNSVVINASSNMTINTMNANFNINTYSNLTMQADNSNMFINMLMPSDVMKIFSLSNMDVGTSNNYNLAVRSNVNIDSYNVNMFTGNNTYWSMCNNMKFTVCNNVLINAKNTIDLEADAVNITTRSDINYTARSNLNFFISAAQDSPQDPIFTVSGNVVKVRGDLLITGSINTSNIVNTTVIQENLKVQDKIILLSSVGDGSSNDNMPFDGPTTNSESGIEIDGFPVGVSNELYDMHKKSLFWHYGTNGTKDLGTGNMTTESFWELQGGSFRLTQKRNYGTGSNVNIQDVSFALRINELDELELVKRWYNVGTSNYVYKRITRFGRILE
jgi:uncharacterized protein (DUF2345 family)